MTWTRAFIAGLLGLIYPGVGHMYLREWLRAFAWFIIAILAAALVTPPELVEAVEIEGMSVLLDMSEYISLEAYAMLFAIRLLNALDASIIALRPRQEPDQSPSCPNCGGDLDDDLDFCPWCTFRLDRIETNEA